MKLKNSEKYTIFLELVHGCTNQTCLTKDGCNGFYEKKTEMSLKMANDIINDLSLNENQINRVILFGRGDSTIYKNAELLDYGINYKLFSNSFVYPYNENFSNSIWRLYRVDSLLHVEKLTSIKRTISKVFIIVNKHNIKEVSSILNSLKEYQINFSLDFQIQLNHFDARYDSNPSLRDVSLYINYEEIRRYLISNNILFNDTTESEVTSFRDCRAFIIDAWGNVVPCYYLNRPFFHHINFIDTIDKLSEIIRPCDICLDNQSDKWRVTIK